MSIDLSTASDDGLTLILLRVPVKDLIKKCTKVSRQWNRILSDNFFWRKKMEYDGYRLEWPKLVTLSTKTFKWIALKHCFNRNFIKDNWNLELQNEHCLRMDPRWNAPRIVWQRADNIGSNSNRARIEIPPTFLDGEPKIPPGIDQQIEACIAIGSIPFSKRIVIKLADEGLTDEIMDNFRPTIVVTEMVGNHRDCASTYIMKCSLGVSRIDGHFRSNIPNENQREYRSERRDVNGRWIGTTIELRFKQGEDEGWHRVEHIFKAYPIGMRYLILYSAGTGLSQHQNIEHHYALKLANCSVKALC